jgi:alkylresorcinol/alkylpyrone synthase
VHAATGVGSRHLTLPIEAYARARTFSDSNARFVVTASDLAAEAITDALRRTSVRPDDVDFLLFVSTTGVACPSVDALVVHRVGLRRDVRRLPIVGLGCAGGAAGIARCADLMRGHADGVGLVVCVELCSLTFQSDDLTAANLVATGLFGDAAACAVVVGHNHAIAGAPRIVASRSMLLESTEEILGFDIGERGFRVVLSPELPDVAVRRLPVDLDGLLYEHGLGRKDIAAWIVHPGGPKVLRAIATALELPDSALERSWRCLRSVGNVSSASVLCMLRDLIAAPPSAGSYGMVIGMGPGFSVEVVLMQW